ncbi:Crp/Fnr family transcriptional regulator [Sphingobacterium chuzhouense]|uniref:Crp/Fnr family transcriptional regulator n=1 Tax=Sphingobacterium chuzhouense TaxID=1742264 RepID=A0ABR7XTW7_9SPHI|nr:Crp/Fnr family transcriptional regulator [Sphingobacterium chuzhouense]MBD1421787.1 Crp/Fnr family transcriptional regulator [Sphingobacterium chuzhouense]
MQLIPYLKTTFGLTDDLLEHLEQVAVTKRYLKKDIILDAAHYSRKVFFIEQGLVRMFYYKSGKAITHYFFSEQTFAGGTESVFYNKKSMYGIEALEPSIITLIPFYAIAELASHSIAMNKLIQAILLQALIGFSARLQSLQFETAQERYHKLMEQHPDILLRAPLGDIASYLGISQQTLSVIRSQR